MTEPTHTPLPCPFCGCPLVGVSIPVDPRFKRSVKCPSCHSHGGWGDDDAEAIDAWNTRADSHHRLVEALEAERTWHEDHDKAISKQPNANTGDNGWRRMEHQERIAEIDAALKEAGQ